MSLLTQPLKSSNAALKHHESTAGEEILLLHGIPPHSDHFYPHLAVTKTLFYVFYKKKSLKHMKIQDDVEIHIFHSRQNKIVKLFLI